MIYTLHPSRSTRRDTAQDTLAPYITPYIFATHFSFCHSFLGLLGIPRLSRTINRPSGDRQASRGSATSTQSGSRVTLVPWYFPGHCKDTTRTLQGHCKVYSIYSYIIILFSQNQKTNIQFE